MNIYFATTTKPTARLCAPLSEGNGMGSFVQKSGNETPKHTAQG
jgi:hypothetical protein